MNYDSVKCQICGYEARVLTQHVKLKHSLTRSEYEEFYDSPCVCQARKDVQVKRNKELNTPEFNEMMKPIRHANGIKSIPYLREGDKRYKASEEGKRRNREIALKYLQTPEMIERSHKWHKSGEGRKASSERLSSTLSNKWANDPDWRERATNLNGKKIKYTLSNSQAVYLRSSWEYKVYEQLIKLPYKFQYEGLKVNYVYENYSHNYFPDFYIEDLNLVLEVKPSCYTNDPKNEAKKLACLNEGYNFMYITEDNIDHIVCTLTNYRNV